MALCPKCKRPYLKKNFIKKTGVTIYTHSISFEGPIKGVPMGKDVCFYKPEEENLKEHQYEQMADN